MSYRLLSAPSQALGSGLSGLLSRIRTLNQRIKWPGSVQSSSPGDVTLSEQVDTLLASVTLDPGRWLVSGGTSIYTAYDRILGYRTYCSIAGGPFATTASGDGPSYAGSVEGLTVFSTGTISTRTVVQLRGSWNGFGASIYPNCTATRIFLIATPA